jgi:serine/threonine protein kinase
VLYKAKRIAYELVVSLLTIIPGFGVFFAARRTQHNYNKIKNDLNHEFEGERKVHDEIYAEAKAVKQIWEISLESMDFVRHADAPPLGAGAFGVVRKACWLGADVAVKELSNVEPQGMNDTMVRRKAVSRDFLKEADVMKALQHPNIVHFYGIGHRYNNNLMEKEHFLVQELMQNGTLKDYLHDKARISDAQLDWPLRHRFLNDICSAISFLHSRDPPMIHRDLKPANCLLDGHLTLKVADFGTVKWKRFQARQRSSTKTARVRDQQPRMMATEETDLSENDGSPVGTPLYMAPECFSRELAGRDGPGAMVDVWAFSFVLFEICTREKPFDGVRFFMNQIVDGKRPTDFMRTDHAQIPNHLYDLMTSCWRKEPSQRPLFRATATAGGSIEARLTVAAATIQKATTL